MPKHHTQSDNIKPAPRGGEVGDSERTIHIVSHNG